MSERPRVSIVLPTHNGARFLAEALDSCLSQTLEDWELIVVDDGSTDNTPEIIADFARRDPRIRALCNLTNLNLPASLNRGFRQAGGVCLTWTSDDNCYRPDALKQMHAFLEDHGDVDLVYCDATHIDENGDALRVVRAEPPEELPMRNVVGACFLYRHRVRAGVGDYAENRFLAEDYDYWLRASINFRLRPLNEDLYRYRWHSTSLTQVKAAAVNRARDAVLLHNLPAMKWMSCETRANAYAHVVRRALEGRDQDALQSWLRAVRRDPALRLGPRARAAERMPAWLRRLILSSPVVWRLLR